MTYHFPKKILGSHMSLTYKRLMKILRRTYEKILQFRKIWASGLHILILCNSLCLSSHRRPWN